MRLRLSGPENWQQLADTHWQIALPIGDSAVAAAESERAAQQLADARLFYWAAAEPAGEDAERWIERLIAADLPAEQELFGTTFSESTTASGWSLTVIEAGVRLRGGGALASRQLWCLQVLDMFAALRVSVPAVSISSPLRAQIRQVLDSAYPTQAAQDVVCLSDLWQ